MLRAILTNNVHFFREADRIMKEQQFDGDTLIRCQQNVERWLRLHGLGKLLPHESAAILKIQAVVRSWQVRIRLRKKYNMLMNLARLDSIDYLEHAQRLHWVS